VQNLRKVAVVMPAHRKITTPMRQRMMALRAEGVSQQRIADVLADETGVRLSRVAIGEALKTMGGSPQVAANDEAPEVPSVAQDAPRPVLAGQLADHELRELLALVERAPRQGRLQLLARRAAEELLRLRATRANELADDTIVDQILGRFPGAPPPEAMAAAGGLRMIQQVLVSLPTGPDSATLVKSLSDQLSKSLETLLDLVPKPEPDPAKDPAKLIMRQAVRETVLSYLVPVEAKYRRHDAQNDEAPL